MSLLVIHDKDCEDNLKDVSNTTNIAENFSESILDYPNLRRFLKIPYEIYIQNIVNPVYLRAHRILAQLEVIKFKVFILNLGSQP